MPEIKEAQKLGLVQNPVVLKIILRAADAVCETGILRQPGAEEEGLWVGEGDTKFIRVCVLLVSTVCLAATGVVGSAVHCYAGHLQIKWKHKGNTEDDEAKIQAKIHKWFECTEAM